MADKTIGELPNLPAISPLDLLVAQHNEEATKITGATLTNFFKDYIGPVAATSASQMTNTNKVYIYIGNESGYTNGNWYYYNGSTWVSGGAYNSQAVNTDVTLTHEGVPADAEAAGKIVEISETQPAAPANRVWIPETQESTVQIPTWAELQELESDLNDAINANFGKYEILLNSSYTTNEQNYTTWEQGGLNTTGTLITSTTRIRTKFIDVPYDSKVHIKAADGYKISVRVYKGTDITNGVYYTDSTWKTEADYTVPTNCAIRIAYANSSDSAITPTDITDANAPTVTVYPMNMPAKKINHNKILFIGNSKAWNTSEYLAKVLGDLGYLNTEVICPYKGSMTLQEHYDNRTTAYYQLYMCYAKNTYGWKAKTVVPLTQIIADNPDITHVIFQQATGSSDDATTYSCLNDLIGLFSGCNARPKFYLESVWASDATTFDTDTILNVCKTVAEGNSNIQNIIPVGHCIEKLKSNSLFTNVVSSVLYDGTHLHSGFPKTMAALSVVETLFGLNDKLYLSDATADATYLINNLCWNIARETKAYNIVDESWHNLTYTEYFKNYNNVSSYQPKYKKVGNVVTIIGVVTPTGTLAQTQNGYRIAEGLPSDCCPPTTFRVICAGSGMNKWLLNVNTTGTLGASRYGIDTDSDMTTGIWMPFSVTYLV